MKTIYNRLFEHMQQEHSIVLFDSQLQDIIDVVQKSNPNPVTAEQLGTIAMSAADAYIGKVSASDQMPDPEIIYRDGFLCGFLVADKQPEFLFNCIRATLANNFEVLHDAKGNPVEALSKTVVESLEFAITAMEKYWEANPGKMHQLADQFKVTNENEMSYLDTLIENYENQEDGIEFKQAVKEIVQEFRLHTTIQPVRGEWRNMPYMPATDWVGPVRTIRADGTTYLKTATYWGAMPDDANLPAGWLIDNGYTDEVVYQWFEAQGI